MGERVTRTRLRRLKGQPDSGEEAEAAARVALAVKLRAMGERLQAGGPINMHSTRQQVEEAEGRVVEQRDQLRAMVNNPNLPDHEVDAALRRLRRAHLVAHLAAIGARASERDEADNPIVGGNSPG